MMWPNVSAIDRVIELVAGSGIQDNPGGNVYP